MHTVAEPFPVFQVGPFAVPQGAAGAGLPLKEVFTPDEWAREVRSIQSTLRQYLETLDKRREDTLLERKNPMREDKAANEIRDAINLLGSALVLVLEDGLAAGEEFMPLSARVFPTAAGVAPTARYYSFEQMVAEEMAKAAGRFGSRLHIHYLAQHPELLPHRHWMVMQAMGAAFAKLLVAAADMRATYSE